MKRSYSILRDIAGPGSYSQFIWSRTSPSKTAIQPQPIMERLDSADEDEISDVARHPDVVCIAPIMRTKLIVPHASDSAVEGGVDSWGISAIGADKTAYSGDDVVVAVLDTGIDRSHDAFAGMAINEQDFTGEGNGDFNGHGTHCAGTIFGRDVEGARIGIARGVKRAVIAKVLSHRGEGDTHWLYDGICWAISAKAKVLSISLGFDFPGFVNSRVDEGWPVDLATSDALEAYRLNTRQFDTLMHMIEIRKHIDGGALVVAAAGNESKRDIHADYRIAASIPAAADQVISVGALVGGTDAFEVAPFSNTNVTIAAPGVDISSARLHGGLVKLSGTSMACPHVAGVAALWWEAVRRTGLPWTSETVRAKLLASAQPDNFKLGVGISDRGVGIVRAP